MALYIILQRIFFSSSGLKYQLGLLSLGGNFGKMRIFPKICPNFAVSAQAELQRRRAGQREVVQGHGQREGDGQLLHLQACPSPGRQEADQASSPGNKRPGQSDTVNVGNMQYFGVV